MLKKLTFRAIWGAIQRWWWPVAGPPALPKETPIAVQAKPEQGAEPAPVVTEISSNRHERRQLERARRKYDKFVTPKGALPQQVAKPRQQIKPKAKKVEVITPAETIDDAE